MAETELLQKYQKAYDFLDRKGIMELRSYGRAVGVRSPSNKSKYDLILKIIKIATGIEERSSFSKKGAPLRSKPISDGEINELKELLNQDIESQQCSTEQQEFVLGGMSGVYNLKGKLNVFADGSFNLQIDGIIEQQKLKG